MTLVQKSTRTSMRIPAQERQMFNASYIYFVQRGKQRISEMVIDENHTSIFSLYIFLIQYEFKMTTVTFAHTYRIYEFYRWDRDTTEDLMCNFTGWSRFCKAKRMYNSCIVNKMLRLQIIQSCGKPNKIFFSELMCEVFL